MGLEDNFGDKIGTGNFAANPENINREGRPVGSLGRSTLLKKWLDVNTTIKDEDTGEVTKGTYLDRVNLALIKKAMGGDVIAIKEILDTLYGKITEKKEIDQNITSVPKIIFENVSKNFNGD